jgi:hypothetical protein
LCDRPVPGLHSFLPSFDLVCFGALPAGEPAEGRAFPARWLKETRCLWRRLSRTLAGGPHQNAEMASCQSALLARRQWSRGPPMEGARGSGSALSQSEGTLGAGAKAARMTWSRWKPREWRLGPWIGAPNRVEVSTGRSGTWLGVGLRRRAIGPDVDAHQPCSRDRRSNCQTGSGPPRVGAARGVGEGRRHAESL